ncbi:taste receptor type 2 member 8-like [Elgaria multicarinata webbii]|uniref:taste receptor type 2 member 8-like n=1 Tax=Elgaria multicarinata webbii TaxID=159646 RepID=UPI002FCCF76F
MRPPLPTIAFLVAVADLALCGIISNGFIVTVKITEWAKSKRLTSSNQLLLSIGISNFSTTILLTVYFLCKYSTDTGNSIILQILNGIAAFAVYSRFWLTALLCVFYCIKIVNSNNSLFLWCKMRISWLIPQLLVGSLVISMIVSIFSIRQTSTQSKSNTTANIRNVTQAKTLISFYTSSQLLFLSICSGCPLLVVLLCSILVVASLCRHVCRMTSKESSFRNLQAEAHVRAAGTVLSLLILYLLLYLTENVAVLIHTDKNRFVYVFVLLVYAPAQATILILVNPKLNQEATRMLTRTKS